jgi:hypothetical protein
MTRRRWEVELEGSADGETWVVMPFRVKPPQAPAARALAAAAAAAAPAARKGEGASVAAAAAAALRAATLDTPPPILLPGFIRRLEWRLWFVPLDVIRRLSAAVARGAALEAAAA